MNIPTYRLGELTSTRVDEQFRKMGAILLRNVIPADLVRATHEKLRTIINDPMTPQRFPFDREARTGYTPVGTEAFQRDPKARDMNRHLFDYRPELPIDAAELKHLFAEAVNTCRHILLLIGMEHDKDLVGLPLGRHSLRSAQYLKDGLTSADILFGERRDFSLFTAFIGFGEPGLQVGCKGVWHPVQLGYGDILIGAGTPLRKFIPEYRALVHRVVGGGNDFRLSAFLFYELGDDVPLPGTNETYGEMWRRITTDIRTPA